MFKLVINGQDFYVTNGFSFSRFFNQQFDMKVEGAGTNLIGCYITIIRRDKMP